MTTKPVAVIAVRYICPVCEAHLTMLINHPHHCPGCDKLYIATGEIRTVPKVVNMKVKELDHDPVLRGFESIRLEDIP